MDVFSAVLDSSAGGSEGLCFGLLCGKPFELIAVDGRTSPPSTSLPLAIATSRCCASNECVWHIAFSSIELARAARPAPNCVSCPEREYRLAGNAAGLLPRCNDARPEPAAGAEGGAGQGFLFRSHPLLKRVLPAAENVSDSLPVGATFRRSSPVPVRRRTELAVGASTPAPAGAPPRL